MLLLLLELATKKKAVKFPSPIAAASSSLVKLQTNKGIIIPFRELQLPIFHIQIEIRVAAIDRPPPPVSSNLVRHSLHPHPPLLTNALLQPFIFHKPSIIIIIIRNVNKLCNILSTQTIVTLNLVIHQWHTRFTRVVLPELLTLHDGVARLGWRLHRHALEGLPADLAQQRAILVPFLVLEEVPAVGARGPKRRRRPPRVCVFVLLAVVAGAAFGVGEHVPGLLNTCEGLVGERELIGVRWVEEECEFCVLPPREVAVAAVRRAELEDGVEVGGGEDVGYGEDAGDEVGGREATGEVAARGEAAEGEHGETRGGRVFGFGSPERIHLRECGVCCCNVRV